MLWLEVLYKNVFDPFYSVWTNLLLYRLQAGSSVRLVQSCFCFFSICNFQPAHVTNCNSLVDHCIVSACFDLLEVNSILTLIDSGN